jgi:hypothetical protein
LVVLPEKKVTPPLALPSTFGCIRTEREKHAVSGQLAGVFVNEYIVDASAAFV